MDMGGIVAEVGAKLPRSGRNDVGDAGQDQRNNPVAARTVEAEDIGRRGAGAFEQAAA